MASPHSKTELTALEIKPSALKRLCLLLRPSSSSSSLSHLPLPNTCDVSSSSSSSSPRAPCHLPLLVVLLIISLLMLMLALLLWNYHCLFISRVCPAPEGHATTNHTP